MAVVVADDLFEESFPESEFIAHSRDQSKDQIARKLDVPNDEDHDDDDLSRMAENIMKSKSDENGQAMHVGTPMKLKLDPKDPLRPRRKKARRACYACQRAHLTCGDERPCQRCIKRGLADACQDGVRKKAKYLHDAPPEALRPVLGPNYKPNYNQPKHVRPTNGYSMTRGGSENSSDRISGLFSSEVSPLYPIFNQSDSMPPPLQARLPMDGQSSTISSSPSFNRQVPSTIHNVSIPTPIPNENQISFENASLFDQNNPAFFNFDLEGLNFGNYYGALEFGMLGHISSGAVEISLKDQIRSIPLQDLGDVNLNGIVYGNGLSNYNQVYQSDTINFGNQPESQIFPAHQNLPSAFAIATGPQSRYSPSVEASPSATGVYENSPTTATFTPNSTPHMPTPKSLKPAKLRGTGTSSESGTGINFGKRSRDSSFIFDKVQEPYCYTTGFHNLTAFLQSRFSQSAIHRIAKSLASIRPSFISCTMTLNRQDLVFMEKCFQRTLFEYEDFMYNCCTPTIVCRRTGEIAAVNQEFTLMTGWRKNVLLGKEPNLNINTGKPTTIESNFYNERANISATQVTSGPGSLEQLGKEAGPQPVLLAELLDDESVVEFFQDFARLAFNESRGSVTARCKLLKYWSGDKDDGNQSPKVLTTMKTAESRGQGQDERSDVDVFVNGKRRCDSTLGGTSSLGNKRLREENEKHETEHFERDRILDCTYCWTLKRDVFDIPMMIVMNVGLSLSLAAAFSPRLLE
ncbi:Transcription activator of gluconeogenesis [Golovinomyces cichoracearum]|uniref:Transcription activator of gluconeogenesis n=1 Tax=Golovinomyces cichoracearum TaxID=62708 RepID=A0A420INF1_9PEZI|nr:Transcription activator of gluconeogenesis [Golovinomyces cichoracearum]